MRLENLFLTLWIALAQGLDLVKNRDIGRRQDNLQSAFPTLGGSSASDSATISSALSVSNTQSISPASNIGSTPPTASGSPSAALSPTHVVNNTSTASLTTTATSIIPTSTPSGSSNATSGDASNDETVLPLAPRITPALSIGGVVLILTGIVYALIGVKNKWIHVFLSTAFLTSLSITVLIIYVLNPPVTDPVQGAYFVGIFMTGVIFGGGALIFKEVTEGLGCLLGGFCLGMWFLTLKEGGLITSTGGKAIFITAFCVISWSLSFSHYTRTYGLIVSIAFSGATAFVLGIDCFSRGGLKEFWLYIWNLNSNIFPLNTNAYPISRGTRVESIVIVLAAIIGVISQLKLWKVVKDRQKKRNEAQQEEHRRQEAVEAALGRHLERQNDRDRSQWEKQYGDRLAAKRETILWTDAHGEKCYSKIRELEMENSQKSSSSESLEMKNMARNSRSMYVTRIKRTSIPVMSIPEDEEDDSAGHRARVRQNVLDRLEGNVNRLSGRLDSYLNTPPAATPTADEQDGPSSRLSLDSVSREHSPAPIDNKSEEKGSHCEHDNKRSSDLDKYLAAPRSDSKKRRRSFAPFLSRSKDETGLPTTSRSTEALVVPETSAHHSRASSLAATLDFENENLELMPHDLEIAIVHQTPDIMVSQTELKKHRETTQPKISIRPTSPEEPELAHHNVDLDPEEFVRPMTEDVGKAISSPSFASGRQSGSEIGTDLGLGDISKARPVITETLQGEILTQGALDRMPSQLSHVVMSYRTNEWAKHISTADAPLYEEPERVEEDIEAEAPAHLADLASELGSKDYTVSQPPPPEVQIPVASAVPSTTDGIRVNPIIQPDQQQVVSPIVKQIPPPIPQTETGRVRSLSDGKPIQRGLRSTSTPMLVRQVAQNGPIDENCEARFVSQQNHKRPFTAQSINQFNTSSYIATNKSSPALNNYPSVHRSASRLSMLSETDVLPTRTPSQMSSYSPVTGLGLQTRTYSPYAFQTAPTHSDTRLDSYNSHQPIRRNASFENQKRENMLADWRIAHQNIPRQADNAETHRQQMLLERHQAKTRERQEQNYKKQHEFAIDARMRGKDMQELHREAMRKMQANANKKMTG